MIIQLTDIDLNHMPAPLCTDLLKWFQTRQSRISQPSSPAHTSEAPPQQLNFQSALSNLNVKNSQQNAFTKPTNGGETQSALSDDLCSHSHVKISQLFDIGLLAETSQMRIRLKRDNANRLGYSYVTSGIHISSRGTMTYDGEEFDKPSPLAAKVNGSPVNGWAYIEIKRNGQWICLNELRKVWRDVS